MEKYKFTRRMEEGTLVKMDGHFATVLLDGKEVEACCQAMGKPGAKGIPCLVSKNDDSREMKYTVEAVDLGKMEGRENNWVCLKPSILEEAVSFFGEKIFGDVEIVRNPQICGKAGVDFETRDAWVEIKAPYIGQNMAGMWSKQIKKFCRSFCRAVNGGDIPAVLKKDDKRHVVLFMFQQELKDEMKDEFCKELKNGLGMAGKKGMEVWIIEMKIEEDGISLVSCQEMTDAILSD